MNFRTSFIKTSTNPHTTNKALICTVRTEQSSVTGVKVTFFFLLFSVTCGGVKLFSGSALYGISVIRLNPTLVCFNVLCKNISQCIRQCFFLLTYENITVDFGSVRHTVFDPTTKLTISHQNHHFENNHFLVKLHCQGLSLFQH